MKEFAELEQKAKRYDEALEKAKRLYEKGTITESLCRIFPELKESEDEEIRKELMDFVVDNTICKDGRREKWIVWLEKQGKETSWKPSKEEMDVLYGLAYITNQYDEHKEEVITRLYQDLKREFFNGSSSENMFPNTSTEDDVRRRSTIQVLEYARSLDAHNQFGKADIDKNIAWLEKQSSNNIKWNKNTKDNKPQVNHSVLMQTINGIAEGEWQGEQWHQYRWAGIVRDSDVLSWIELYDIEKQSKESKVEEAMREVEEKAEAFTAAHQGENADVILAEMRGEIKPKFHEGDWIISNNKKYIYQVVKVKRDIYVVRDNADDREYHVSIESADRDGRLWNISDAKEGDVLASELCGTIMLYKGIKDNNIQFYCDYDLSDIDVPGDRFAINNGQHYGSVDDSDDWHPATKEQRDTLMKAMADAGYTFDFEKKELKKLGQQEVTKISDQEEDSDWREIPFGAKDSEFIEGTYYIPEGCYAEIVGNEVVIKKGKRNPAWNEEDEHRAEDTIYFLDTAKKHYASTVELDACIDWLKSIKQRIGG